MELKLQRDSCGASCTLGTLYVDDAFECYTVEDVVRAPGEKIHGETAIPAGTYRVIINRSARFKRDLPLLVDVPMFEGVRIHPGNTAEDTEGCILPGMVRSSTGVQRSREAFDALFQKMREAAVRGEKITIEISNAFEGAPA